MSALTDIFDAIADAIRAKNGSSDTYTPAEMAQAIEDIPSGGGSSETETTLWTNPDSTYASFADQYITLSESVSNYSKIRIYFKINGGSSSSDISFFDFDTSDLSETMFMLGINSTSGSYGIIRGCWFIANSHENYTKLYVYKSYFYNSTSDTAYNSFLVPTKICGLS